MAHGEDDGNKVNLSLQIILKYIKSCYLNMAAYRTENLQGSVLVLPVFSTNLLQKVKYKFYLYYSCLALLAVGLSE